MADDTLNVTTRDGDFTAYVARPTTDGPWPAVIVLQEIYGVNAVIRGIADALAGQGFLAVAPDLFWRIEPGIDLTDQTEEGNARAFALFGQVDVEKAVEDAAATLAAVRALPECAGKVGAVGYCLGGLLAYLVATRTDSDASVSFYGVGLEKRLPEADKLTRPLMLHIAGEDRFVSKDAQGQINAGLQNHPQVTIHTYAGRDHAFARPNGHNFHAEDARLANDRTLAFFKAHLS